MANWMISSPMGVREAATAQDVFEELFMAALAPRDWILLFRIDYGAPESVLAMPASVPDYVHKAMGGEWSVGSLDDWQIGLLVGHASASDDFNIRLGSRERT